MALTSKVWRSKPTRRALPSGDYFIRASVARHMSDALDKECKHEYGTAVSRRIGRISSVTRIFFSFLALIAEPAFAEKPSADLTSVRGFNYTTSLDESIGPGGHSGLWLKYDASQVERDLANAQRLNLNQVRVFIAYSAWKADPELSNRNLLDFLHACRRHNIGVMLGLIDQPPPVAPSTDAPPELRAWLTEIVKLTAKEPALQFWDAANEPDGAARNGADARTRALAIARNTADI